jgi:putative tryptophan/tyrosine transport system substrate-binding protein
MRRREFIAGLGAAVWPLAARAQQGERARRVGVLTYNPETPYSRTILSILRDDLEQLGWTEGRNVRIDFRFGNGDATQTRVLAADLVHLAPDVIVTGYWFALRAVQQETKTIPVVFIGAGDAVEIGNVINAARPEGNVTGFANTFGSLGGKWLEMLKEVAPNIARVGYLYDPAGGNLGGVYLRSIETAARSLGVQIVSIPASDVASMKAAIGAFAAEPNGGLLPGPAISAIVPFDELSRLAAQYNLPAIYGVPLPPANGGLMSYSFDYEELLRGVATYVDRLLRGTKVSDLPVQYPTKFRLVINLKTARTLGLTIPPNLLALADEVIE